MNRCAPARYTSGFGMIEVLVTLFILLVGLLGLVGLQTNAQKAEMESYQREQALTLMQDMVDRINANRAQAAAYVTVAGPVGTGYTYPLDPGTGCGDLPTIAEQDLCRWDSMLDGAAESLGGASVGAMLGARGCVQDLGGNVYMITVVWQGLTETTAPPASVTCADDAGLYGSAAQRRAVTTLVQIGTLS